MRALCLLSSRALDLRVEPITAAQLERALGSWRDDDLIGYACLYSHFTAWCPPPRVGHGPRQRNSATPLRLHRQAHELRLMREATGSFGGWCPRIGAP